MSDRTMVTPKPARSLVPLAIVAGSLVVAATLALTSKRQSSSANRPAVVAVVAGDSAIAPLAATLPVGHPPLQGTAATMGLAGIAAAPVQAGVRWAAPPRWELVPSESAMRIATYRIPHAPGDAEDAELSITRAGGDTEANVARWLGQFDEVGRRSVKRSEKTISGMRVSVVELAGAYSGMDSPEPQPGFAMLSAIVDTPGTKHFFKVTGPATTVRAAAGEFQALLESLTVVAPP